MSLIDALGAPAVEVHHGPYCRIAVILGRISEAEGVALKAALATEPEDGGLTGSELAERLRKNGHPIRQHTIDRHRRGGCVCAPD